MKRIVLFTVILALLASMAFAGGVSVYNETVTLWSAATGTTGAKTTDHATFSEPVSNLGVDVSTSPTATVTVRIDGNASHFGSFSSAGLATATTCSSATCYFAITGKPVKSIQAVATASTSTTVVTIKVTGMQ